MPNELHKLQTFKTPYHGQPYEDEENSYELVKQFSPRGSFIAGRLTCYLHDKEVPGMAMQLHSLGEAENIYRLLTFEGYEVSEREMQPGELTGRAPNGHPFILRKYSLIWEPWKEVGSISVPLRKDAPLAQMKAEIEASGAVDEITARKWFSC